MCKFKWPSCNDCNARFTAVPLKALSDQIRIINPCFCFICGFSSKVTCVFLAYRKQWIIFQNCRVRKTTISSTFFILAILAITLIVSFKGKVCYKIILEKVKIFCYPGLKHSQKKNIFSRKKNILQAFSKKTIWYFF